MSPIVTTANGWGAGRGSDRRDIIQSFHLHGGEGRATQLRAPIADGGIAKG